MKTIIMLGIMFLSVSAWATCIEPHGYFRHKSGDCEKSERRDAESREARSNRYIDVEVKPSSGIITPDKNFIVHRGSETYTLDEFVSSGKFCEYQGAHLAPHSMGAEIAWKSWRCLYCHKKKMYKSNGQPYWEP